jgi:hypothetical protein
MSSLLLLFIVLSNVIALVLLLLKASIEKDYHYFLLMDLLKELQLLLSKSWKSNNFMGSNREKSNIAIAILEK